MELEEAVRKRRMVRRFDDRPLDPQLLQLLLDSALRGPSAGFSQGVDLLVLEGPRQTGLFWRTTTTPEWEGRVAGREGPVRAPVVVLPLSSRQAYLDRYSEPDKAASAMSTASAWRVPYWTVDAAFSTMLLLLRAVDLGLGALFFRIHGGEDELLSALGVPPGHRPIGAIAVGHPAPDPQPAATRRPRQRRRDTVHRGRW